MKNFLFLTSIILGIMSCSTVEKTKVMTKENKPLKVSIIHINDHHSHLEPDTKITINLAGKPTKIGMGGMAEVATKINELRNNSVNPIVLHAGDAITGTLYFTLFNGSADAEVMNAIGFDAFTLGNHEFDAQNEGLRKFLDVLKVPVVSANVIPEKGSILEGYWKPYIIKNIDGQEIAIIGLDVVNKTKNSSSPGKDIIFIDEIEATQKTVNELQNMGINKIILLSHAGTGKNLEIAKKVSGIDVIISGDWHTLFADEKLKEQGFPVAYNYPEKVMSPSNEPVYVVEGWEYGKFVGNLVVDFDDNGIITKVDGEPKILVQPNFFERRDSNRKKYQANGIEKEEILKDIKSNKWLEIVEADKNVQKIVDKYKAEKDLLAKQVVGSISGKTMPGGSGNRIPGRAESNPKGSVATRFIAETMLSEMKNSSGGNIDFTIQNSGGVRADITPGEVTFNDAYTFLPFGNTLFLLDIKGFEIKEMLEQALDYALIGGSTGAFPYGANIRYEAIEDAEKGNRVKKIEIKNRNTNKWELLVPNKMYRMGTNSYIAGGKDGYVILGEISKNKDRNPEDTYLPDAESFIKFLKRNPNFKSYEESNVKFLPIK